MCINHYKAANAGLGRNTIHNLLFIYFCYKQIPPSLISAQTFNMEIKQQLKHPEGETYAGDDGVELH